MSNIESILEKNKICVTTTKGDSMYPMLVEGRDKVVICTPTFPLKKYDVAVYRRCGHYTMHRVVKVKKNGYIICGDNRAVLERDIKDNDIIGVLTGFYRGDKYISCDDKKYIRYAKSVCREIPVKVTLHNIKRAVKKIKRIFKKG